MNETMSEENEELPELKYRLSVVSNTFGLARVITHVRAYTVGVTGQVAYRVIGESEVRTFQLQPGDELEARVTLRD